VAIKRTHRTLFEQKTVFEDEDGMNEFVEEDVVKEAMLLNHLTVNHGVRGVVEFVDFFESESHFYIVTRYVQGLTLKELTLRARELIRDGRLCQTQWLRTVKSLIWQLTVTLRTLHDVYRCCHLDVCADNVMVSGVDFVEMDDCTVRIADESMEVVLIDFGVAELFRDDSFRCIKGGLTVDNGPYVAPKVFDNDIYDPRKADLWSLGMIFFECVSFERLYLAEDIWDEPQNGYAALKSGKLRGWLRVNQLRRVFGGKCAVSLLDSLLRFDEEDRADAQTVMSSAWFEDEFRCYGEGLRLGMASRLEAIERHRETMASFPFYAEL